MTASQAQGIYNMNPSQSPQIPQPKQQAKPSDHLPTPNLEYTIYSSLYSTFKYVEETFLRTVHTGVL
jgi:hypothetical protein